MVEADIYEKASVIIRVWLSTCPEKKFFGMASDEFTRIIEPSGTVRQEIFDLDQRVSDALKRRADADRKTRLAVLRVINGIKGDPGEGEDSRLLQAMGYLPHTARTSIVVAARKLKNAARAAARESGNEEVKS